MDKKIYSKRKIDVTEDNMRSFRTKILNSENKKLQSIRGLLDFLVCLILETYYLITLSIHMISLKLRNYLKVKIKFLAFNEMNPNVKSYLKLIFQM